MFIFNFLFCSFLAFSQVPAPEVASQGGSSEASEFVNIEGIVLERGTRRPLSDVSVFVLPFKTKSTTDKQGRFKFSNLPKGSMEFVINIANYIKFQKNLEILSSSSELQFFVEKEKYQYFETTVTDLRNKKDDSQKRLRQEEFLQMPGSGGDPVKAVQNLPGVSRTSGRDSRVLIQGSEPEDTRYNIEGHEVPLIFHFGGLSSVVTPEAVGSVDYFSAGYGPELSRALGGHVGLNVRKPKTDRTHGMAFMDLYNIGGLVEGPLDEDSSFLVSGRYSYLGLVLKAVAKDSNDFNLVVAPVFYDLNAQFHKKLNERDELRVFSILSRDHLELVLNKPLGNDPRLRGNFEQTTEFYRLIPQWSRQIDETKKLTASLGVGSDAISFNLDKDYFDAKSQVLSGRTDYEYQILPLWKFNLGLDAIYSSYKVKVKIPSTFSEGGVSNPLSSGDLREANLSGDNYVFGGYWRNEWKLSENSKWTLLPNLRFDYFSSTQEAALQPRMVARYNYDSSLLLRAATGLYYQAPRPQETDVNFGNPEVKSQQAQHFAIGFDKDFREGSNNGYTFGSTIFYKNLNKMVINSNASISRGGVLTPENYNNEGTGYVQGVETQLKYRWDEISLTGSYTYLQSRRKRPGQNELPSPHDQTHSLNILASYETGVWQYGARMRYVTGDPYTEIVGSYYDSDNDVYIPQRGDLYGFRRKDFFQIDFRIDRKWIYDTWILSGYLDIQNVTGYKNQEGISYSYDYSQKKEITGLSAIPTVGVKGEF